MLQAKIERAAMLYTFEKGWRFTDLLKRMQIRTEAAKQRAEADAAATMTLLAERGLSSEEVRCQGIRNPCYHALQRCTCNLPQGRS